MRKFQRLLTAAVQEWQAKGLTRSRQPRSSEGLQGVNFCSNDYLGLSQHPAVIQSAQVALKRWGVGGQSSQLVSGYTELQMSLERSLAEWLGREAVIIFSSGFMANLGVLQALLNHDSTVVADKHCHASLIDGVRLSQAKLLRYRHLDISSVRLQFYRASAPSEQKAAEAIWLLTESVFSMEGDQAPLRALSQLAHQHQANMVLDEAHALGVIGPGGRGLAAEARLHSHEIPVLLGTFGKAFGTQGAFVAGSSDLIEYLQQCTRSLIYTTAPPPAILAATQTSLDIIQSDEGDQLRVQLVDRIQLFREKAQALQLPVLASESAIQPVIIGSAHRSVEVSSALQHKGFWVQAIRPPTVAEGSARLRCVINAHVSKVHIEALVQAIAVTLKVVGS